MSRRTVTQRARRRRSRGSTSTWPRKGNSATNSWVFILQLFFFLCPLFIGGWTFNTLISCFWFVALLLNLKNVALNIQSALHGRLRPSDFKLSFTFDPSSSNHFQFLLCGKFSLTNLSSKRVKEAQTCCQSTKYLSISSSTKLLNGRLGHTSYLSFFLHGHYFLLNFSPHKSA